MFFDGGWVTGFGVEFIEVWSKCDCDASTCGVLPPKLSSHARLEPQLWFNKNRDRGQSSFELRNPPAHQQTVMSEVSSALLHVIRGTAVVYLQWVEVKTVMKRFKHCCRENTDDTCTHLSLVCFCNNELQVMRLSL